MNLLDGESNPKILQHFTAFFPVFFDYRSALKIERKVSYLDIAFDQYASIGTVMHLNLLVISVLLLYSIVYCLLFHSIPFYYLQASVHILFPPI